jgi:hypothetical protein
LRDKDLLERVNAVGRVGCLVGVIMFVPSLLRYVWDRWWTLLFLELGVITFSVWLGELKMFAVRHLPMGMLTTVLRMNVRALYHMAAYDVADRILGGEGFKPGTSGLAGAGIYFATTNSDCVHKAQARGGRFKIIQTRVWLGRVRTIPAHGQSGITLASLQKEGYDSVFIPRGGGDEFVVYDPAQTVPISAT